MKNFSNILIYLTLFLTIAFIFSPIITSHFFADDVCWIKMAKEFDRDTSLKNLFKPDYISGYVRPLNILIFYFNYKIFHLSPLGYYLISLFFHFLNTIILYKLVLVLFANKINKSPQFIAFISSVSFSIIFGHSSAVMRASVIHDLLATLFYQFTILFFINFIRKNSYNLYIFSLLFLILSLLAKEISVTLPVILFVLFLYIRDKPAHSLKIILPYFIIVIFYTIGYFILFPHSRLQMKDEYMIGLHFIPNTFYSLSELFYNLVGDTFNPAVKYELKNLNFLNLIHSLILFTKIILLCIFIIFAGTYLNRREIIKFKKGLIIFCLVWMFITFLPTSFFTSLYDPRAHFLGIYRFLYLPSVGFCILFGYIFATIYEYFKNSKYIIGRPLLFLYIFLFVFSNAILNLGMGQHFKNVSKETENLKQLVSNIKDLQDNDTLFFVGDNFGYTFPKINTDMYIDALLDKKVKVKWISEKDIKNELKYVDKKKGFI